MFTYGFVNKYSTVVWTFLRIAVFVFPGNVMMQWKHSLHFYVTVTCANHIFINLIQNICCQMTSTYMGRCGTCFSSPNFVDFPTQPICLVVMKFRRVASVITLSKPASWMCLCWCIEGDWFPTIASIWLYFITDKTCHLEKLQKKYFPLMSFPFSTSIFFF